MTSIFEYTFILITTTTIKVIPYLEYQLEFQIQLTFLVDQKTLNSIMLATARANGKQTGTKKRVLKQKNHDKARHARTVAILKGKLPKHQKASNTSLDV